MVCPKCYGKIDKISKRCKSCGFNMKSVYGATHKDVKRARKEGFGEDVIYTAELPQDIHKKKLLLLCIFLGLFGAHSYYTGKIFQAIYSTVVSVAMLALSIVNIFVAELSTLFGKAGVWALSIVSLLMGINIVLFIVDLIRIITNKYKVSVYKDEFSE